MADAYIPAGSNSTIPAVLVTLFASGVIVCLLHCMMQLISLRKITANAVLIQAASGIKLYHLNMDIMPFSYGRNIYINQYRHAKNELNDIIQHESVHAQQNHTIDVMIAEFICMLNWYNPFAWLMKHAIKQNLEFLADDTVLKNGADRKNYQYLLLSVTGYSPLSIASSFTLSSLKQRIYMMNKTRTSQKHLLKILLVLPLIAVMMLAFRNDGKVHVAGAVSNTEDEPFMLSKLTYNIQDVNISQLIKNTRNESLLQTGKPFTVATIKNERDRLRSLLEKNGYNNINSHAITFLIDSTFENNRCAIEINIDLKRKALSLNNTDESLNADKSYTALNNEIPGRSRE
ncbi:M56 family metallopeptidase [Parafilimonas sp.]|uniref:M56 family metallopeptidase n=1 Tax=Parafilimonas sp. TaxID=1969739 RepID=UPI0039E614F2